MQVPPVAEVGGWLDCTNPPAGVAAAICAGAADVAADPPSRRRCLELAAGVVAGLGEPEGPAVDWPEATDDGHPWLACTALLAAAPAWLAWAADHRIPASVVWATFSDLPRQVQLHQAVHGGPGLEHAAWLTLHLREQLFQLGRLQFHRTVVRWDQEDLDLAGVPLRPTQPVLGVHIPEAGPLTPRACEASFAAAGWFFTEYFPGPVYRALTCTSWLLDPQLAEYLPEEANIVRFQRRFALLPRILPGDDAVLRFVFHRLPWAQARLPAVTRLQRAIGTHLRAGRHWAIREGYAQVTGG